MTAVDTSSPTAGNGEVAKRFLTKVEILEAKDFQIEEVPVPEWGGPGAFICVRTLTGNERDDFETSLLTGKGKDKDITFKGIRGKMCARVICDPEGNRLFTDAEIFALGQKSSRPIDRIFSKAQEMNGITDKDVEELEKNSNSAPSDGSS